MVNHKLQRLLPRLLLNLLQQRPSCLVFQRVVGKIVSCAQNFRYFFKTTVLLCTRVPTNIANNESQCMVEAQLSIVSSKSFTGKLHIGSPICCGGNMKSVLQLIVNCKLNSQLNS